MDSFAFTRIAAFLYTSLTGLPWEYADAPTRAEWWEVAGELFGRPW